MRTFIHTFYLLALASGATAFKITLYETPDCTGDTTKDLGEIRVADGCQKFEGDIRGSVKIEWTDEADNELSFSTYSSEKCCVVYFVATIPWQDECIPINNEKGFRVLEADIEKGKEGENYMCSDP